MSEHSSSAHSQSGGVAGVASASGSSSSPRTGSHHSDSGHGGHQGTSSYATAPPLLSTTPANTTNTMGARADLSTGAIDAPALTGVRQTEEYRAAWDLELWKAIQAERFRVELEKEKARALAELKKSVREKEKRLRADLEARTQACTAREAKLAQDEAALTQGQAKLKTMEADLRRMRQQLLDAQARVEEEVRAQVRRANDDIAHKAKLLQERVAAAEAQTKRAEERQKVDQAEYLNLYQDFSKFRAERLLSAPGRSSNDDKDVERGGHASSDAAASSSSAMSFYHEQVQRLRAQHAEDLRLLEARLCQQQEARLAEAHHRCRDLEEQNRRLTAALARRREQLRHAPRTAPQRAPTSSTAPAATISSAKATPTGSAAAMLSLSVAELVKEVSRLRNERAALLVDSAGALQPSDAVVRRLDVRIEELQRQLAVRLEQLSSDDDEEENEKDGRATVRVAVR